MPNSSHPLQHSFLPLFVLFFFLSSSLATPLSLHHSIKQLKKTKPMEGGQEEVIIRISQQGVYHISVKNNKEELSFEEVFRLWQFHQDFRTKWIKALQEVSHSHSFPPLLLLFLFFLLFLPFPSLPFPDFLPHRSPSMLIFGNVNLTPSQT